MKLFQLQERSIDKRQDDIVKFAAVTEGVRQDLNKVMKDVDELRERVGKVIDRMNEEKRKDPAKELEKNPAFKELYRAMKGLIDNRHAPSLLERNPAFTGLRNHYNMLANKVVGLEKMLDDVHLGRQRLPDQSDEPVETPNSGLHRDVWQQSMANSTMPSMTDVSNFDAPNPAYPQR